MSLSRSLYESTDTPAVDDILDTISGELAFDIGASGGRVASLLASRFTVVIACEPSPEPYEHLVEYAAPNVRPIPLAVSDRAAVVTFDLREMSSERGYYFTGDAALEEWGAVTGCSAAEATTLHFLATEFGQPDFVKIDTEGHEVPIVMGGLDILRASRFLIEVHSRADGKILADLLPDHRVIRHQGRKPNSHGWHDHYWMVRT